MTKKNFYILNEAVKVENKIKNSIFICTIDFAESTEQAKNIISEISSQYKDANHNCWAYIVGKNADIFHSSDNGEPSGTAGKPMLNTLQKYNLTNTVVVVTRYFGGIKLGVRGLIDAYSESTEQAINTSNLSILLEFCKYKIITNYDYVEQLKYKLKSLFAEINDIQYNDKVELIIQVEESISQNVIDYLIELENSGKLNIVI